MTATRAGLLAAAMLLHSPLAWAERLPLFEGQQYDLVRGPLIQRGYRPAGRSGEMPGYPEAAECRPDGFCIMRWKRGRNVVEVGTHGYPSTIEMVKPFSR